MYLPFTTHLDKPPLLRKHGLLVSLEIIDLTPKKSSTSITQQEPSDSTEKQKVAWSSDHERDRRKLVCGIKLE